MADGSQVEVGTQNLGLYLRICPQIMYAVFSVLLYKEKYINGSSKLVMYWN